VQKGGWTWKLKLQRFYYETLKFIKLRLVLGNPEMGAKRRLDMENEIATNCKCTFAAAP
jgi:hypothetical protein